MSPPRSPVLNLENAIAGAAFRIAPEKGKQLAAFRDLEGVSLALADGPGFVFNVNLRSREISTNVATLEFLWCSAHAHLVLYNEYSQAQRNGQTKFDTARLTVKSKPPGAGVYVNSVKWNDPTDTSQWTPVGTKDIVLKKEKCNDEKGNATVTAGKEEKFERRLQCKT